MKRFCSQFSGKCVASGDHEEKDLSGSCFLLLFMILAAALTR